MSDIKLEYKVGLDDLQKFKNSGVFSNNIDDFGNFKIIFSDGKTTDGKYYYTDLPLKTFKYDEEKIKDTNPIEFSELQSLSVVQKQDINVILQQYNDALEENRILNETVNALVEKYENNDDKQVIEAMKSEIVNLRISLGQGNTPSDFSDDFPFLPLT